jgi:hypothetical protein
VDTSSKLNEVVTPTYSYDYSNFELTLFEFRGSYGAYEFTDDQKDIQTSHQINNCQINNKDSSINNKDSSKICILEFASIIDSATSHNCAINNHTNNYSKSTEFFNNIVSKEFKADEKFVLFSREYIYYQESSTSSSTSYYVYYYYLLTNYGTLFIIGNKNTVGHNYRKNEWAVKDILMFDFLLPVEYTKVLKPSFPSIAHYNKIIHMYEMYANPLINTLCCMKNNLMSN